MEASKRVDVIRPGSLKQIIGPAGTLKRILKSKSYFIDRGYDINIYTYDSLLEGKANIVPVLNKHETKKCVRGKVKKYIRANLYKSKFLSLIFLKRADRYIQRLIDFYFSLGNDSDYVIFHSVAECYHYLIRNKKNDVKTVCFFHTDGIPLKMEEIYYPKLRGSKYFLKLLARERFVVENVDLCVFIAEHGRKNFLTYYPFVDISKTRLILNGIEDFSREEQNYMSSSINNSSNIKYRFCCVGTINTRKGHRIIIDALSMLDRSKLSRFHFTFVGDGAERVFLEKIVKDSGLSENVEFIGAVDNKEIFKYLLNSDIYILMSKNEGLPISIIEAMRASLPIISTKIAGIPELVNETNGILIEPAASQLVSVFSDMENYNWKEMGEKSRKRFLEEFTFDRMRREYCNMLDSI